MEDEMSLKTVMKRIQSEGQIDQWLNESWSDEPKRPDRNLIAFNVAYSRELKGMSALSLASIAGVSESSIERIERGNTVSDTTLNKVALALGYEDGSYTHERVKLKPEESLKSLQDNLSAFENTIQMPVEPFSKQVHIRNLSRCHLIIVDAARLNEDAQKDTGEIREYLSRANWLRTEKESDLFSNPEPFNQIRELNNNILEIVKRFELEYRAYALTGTYQTNVKCGSLDMLMDIGVLAFFPKDTDPYAIKRSHLLVSKDLHLTEESFYDFDG
jgi:transcriptional regulator with XRE-family HTH domain